MAYPADTAVETAIATIELVLVENFQFLNNRETVAKWRELLRQIELRIEDGATGYDALAQKSASAWVAYKEFGAS